MNKRTWIVLLVVAALVLAGWGAAVTTGSLPVPWGLSRAVAASTSSASTTIAPVASAPAPLAANSTIAALESAFQGIYEDVSPSVVAVEVVQQTTISPFGGSFGQQGLGSGFVWDTDGHIVTNNHVIDSADRITVIFSDDSTAQATVVGRDPQTDLAVLKVDVPASQLKPVRMGDSTTAKVGELVVAIGNPFGEQNTMTTGIISALGRSYPADQTGQGPSYTIPNVIQTDAAINPGNSGGVLLDTEGSVIGVTFAIESPVRASSGIGFAIPAEVVKRVVPVLISKGSFEHPYLGISGTDLTPDLAKAMGLKQNQRGVLVGDVTAGGPAAAAGVRGSSETTTINGSQVEIGGDVIIAINGQAVKTFNDLVSYLVVSAEVGQKVNLTILRDGSEQTVAVTLAARPTTTAARQSGRRSTPDQALPTTRAYLGIRGLDLTSDIAQAMGLSADQRGVLIVSVQSGSPADSAGLRGGTRSVTIGGTTVMIGGDVIVAMNGKPVTGMQDLQSLLAKAKSGDKATLTILRDGKQMRISVTLGSAPTTP